MNLPSDRDAAPPAVRKCNPIGDIFVEPERTILLKLRQERYLLPALMSPAELVISPAISTESRPAGAAALPRIASPAHAPGKLNL
jgi:hypothetical protein